MKRKAWTEVLFFIFLISLFISIYRFVFLNTVDRIVNSYFATHWIASQVIVTLFTVLAMIRISRIRGYKMEYYKSAGICVLICLPVPFISRILLGLAYDNFQNLEREWFSFKIYMLNWRTILMVAIACITAAFFTKNKYVPKHTDILDEQEIDA